MFLHNEEFNPLEEIVEGTKKNKETMYNLLKNIDKNTDKIYVDNITKNNSNLINNPIINEFLQKNFDTNDIELSNIDNNKIDLDENNYMNLNNYNHKRKILNIGKKIKQDFTINYLNYKIDKLLNSIKDVNELKM